MGTSFTTTGKTPFSGFAKAERRLDDPMLVSLATEADRIVKPPAGNVVRIAG